MSHGQLSHFLYATRATASSVATQRSGAEAKQCKPLAFPGLRQLLPLEIVDTGHTASHSFLQPPITKVYFEYRGFGASCLRRRPQKCIIYICITKLNRCQECWVWNHHLIMIHPRTDTVCKQDASSTFIHLATCSRTILRRF